MAPEPPNSPWNQRFWNSGTRRPTGFGCFGCLGILLVGLLVSAVLSALLPNSSVLCLPFVF